jgi:dTDP-4-dehydrorhamnose 3,5-epimerase
MNVERFEIPDLMLIESCAFEDERGFFTETYSKKKFSEIGIDADFVQDNMSRSKKGVVRGLHFQRPPHAQDKLVRVIQGTVMDVAVDLRVGSPTYGKYQAVILSESNRKILFIPKGFAHGFITLSEFADFEYKASDFYHPETEGGIIWNDPDIAIDWHADSLAHGIPNLIIGAKDQMLPSIKNTESIFIYGT